MWQRRTTRRPVIWLLDTNTLVYILNGEPRVRAHANEAGRSGRVATSIALVTLIARLFLHLVRVESGSSRVHRPAIGRFCRGLTTRRSTLMGLPRRFPSGRNVAATDAS